jgi:2-iminobutanoate/2-iminopropanoate deaminase
LTNKIDSEDIGGQTHQVMKNLQNALEGADSSFALVAKTTILLTDINNFAKVNEIYGSYFADKKFPARVTYAVSALPKGSLV